MDEHTLRILEFKEIKEIIARKTTNPYGRKFVEGIYPQEDMDTILEFQQDVREGVNILNAKESFVVGDLKEVRTALEMAEKEVALDTGDLLAIHETLIRARLLKKYLEQREFIAPSLTEKSQVLTPLPEIEKIMKRSVSSDGSILDSATSDLTEIRRNMVKIKGKIHTHLDAYLKNPEHLKMLQEPIITSREHRYVLPVKQEFSSQFPGIVLDSSASGATVFMEPLSVLKLTNELKYLQSEEKREMERIRLRISKMMAMEQVAIERNLNFLGYFDGISACSRYMLDCNCSLPLIEKDSYINLLHARHPLLGERAVPITIRVGRDFNGLIITGPNTGGKTVSLKTAGVLTVMALCGLPIPAGEDSAVGIFTGVYADIGDEQSIQQNLSTFSSHMTQIIRILKRMEERSLVLLDEVGAGTDPSEGVALGSSIIDYIIKKGAKVLATTHYNELKAYASQNPQLKNAAMEFDEETLQPTYKISIGLPGRSCALKISRRLGLPGEIIDSAGTILGEGYFHIDHLLSEIDRERKWVKQEKEQIMEKKETFESLSREYEGKIKELESEQGEILEEVRKKGEAFLEEVLSDLREAKKEFRKTLKDFRQGKKTREELKEEESRVRGKMNETLERLKDLEREKKAEEKLNPSMEVKEGDLIYVPNLGKRGTVVHQLDPEMIMVAFGNIKMEIPVRDIEKVELRFPEEGEVITKLRTNKALSISDSLDLRGYRVEEALEVIDKFMDDAHLANLNSFTLLHGKGTGALRKFIHEYLAKNRRIKSFRDGDLHEGGWGVTVVNL